MIAELQGAVTWDHLNAPDEEYLKVAVTRLLPKYYGMPADENAGVILHKLADRLRWRHGDAWLADAIKTRHSQSATAAFEALGRAQAAADGWDYSAAGEEARTALPLFESLGSTAGVLYSKIEQVNELDWYNRRARECMEQAGALQPPLRAHQYSWLDVQALLEEGSCATRVGDLERADMSERAALESAAKDKDDYAVLFLRALGLIASRHAKIGNAAAAWRENFSGLKRYWDGPYLRVRAYQFYSALSLFADQSNSPYSALAWAREADSIVSTLEYPFIRAASQWQLLLAEFGASLRAQAYSHLRQLERLNPKTASRPVPVIELATLETNQGELDEARTRLLAIQKAAEEDNELIRLRFEAELARVQLRRDEYQDAARLFRGALEIGERSWSRAPEPGRLQWARTMENIYRGLLECQIRTGGDHREALNLWSQYRSHLFEQGSQTAGADAPLAPGEARLSFAGLSTGVAVWLETDRGLEFRELKSSELLRQAAGRLARGCSSEQSPEVVLRGDARELSKEVLGPWDTQLDGVRTVVVETDAPVASVPWSALMRSNGHYWAQDFAVRIRAGVGTGIESRAPLAGVERVLAVGAPAISGEDGLVALPHSREEAEKVSALFPRSTPLTGKLATWSEVRQRLGEVQLFHFSGHGYGGEGGGLLLRGPEGRLALLQAADIRNLDLKQCRLVVLGGCSTAAGERSGPGDPQSLVQAFLHAGAQDVVAGLWNLDSAGTQVLMQAFYSAILSGDPIAESLRKAAQAVRQDERFTHPYYWAGLELFSGS